MPKGRETALGRVRGLAPHRGYAAITRYVQLPPVHGRSCATRMHGILIKADWKPPATFDTHFTDQPCKINRASYQKIIFAERPKRRSAKGMKETRPS